MNIIDLLLSQHGAIMGASHRLEVSRLEQKIARLESELHREKSMAEYYKQLYMHEKLLRESDKVNQKRGELCH